MLYTTYLDNLDKTSKYAIKLIVMRYIPDINILKYQNIHFEQSLSPSKEILDEYNNLNKSINDWNIFKNKFLNEIKQRQDIQNSIKKIVKLVNMGMDIYLICHEINGNLCHRTLLAQYIKEHYNINWKEL